MNRHHRRNASTPALLLACVAAAALAFTVPAFAADATASAPPVVHTKAVSSVLSDVAASREWIAKGNIDRAIFDLGAPKDLLENLLGNKKEAALARRGLRDTLEGVKGQGAPVILEQVRPILADLDTVVEGEPAWQSKKEIEKAERLLEQGQRDQAIAALRRADAQLEFTRDELPLVDAYGRIQAALRDLKKGESLRADAQLAALEHEAKVEPLAAVSAPPR